MSTIAVTNLKHESASGNNITLASTGRVGIGTSSPANPLDIVGNDGVVVRRSGQTNGFIFRPRATDDGCRFSLEGTGDLMSIDSAGRVTMPYQPAFFVAKQDGHVATGVTIVFNAVHYNNGGHYSTSTGRFTAPVAGMYFFSACVLDNSGGWATTRLMKNGSELARQQQNAQGGTTQASSNVIAITYMNANDYVDVNNPDGATYGTGGTYTSFKGFLLG